MATENDLVLVHVDNKPGFYARIEEITPDVKVGWWQVKLLVLTFPLQIFTWILDDSQIEGEPFTMGGTPLQLEKLVSPLETQAAEKTAPLEQKPKIVRTTGQKVVSLADRRKNSPQFLPFLDASAPYGGVSTHIVPLNTQTKQMLQQLSAK